MQKTRGGERAARLAIYAIFILTVAAFVLFANGARQHALAAGTGGAMARQATPLPVAQNGAAGPAQGNAAAGAQQTQAPPVTRDLPLPPLADLPALAPATPATEQAGGAKEMVHEEKPYDAAALAAERERMAAMGFDVPGGQVQYVGSFHATAYCCEVYPHICGGNGVTASGTVPTPGLTAAADWRVLPPGTWLYIGGVGIRRVEDSGSAIVSQRLDIAIDTHENALRWGGFGRHDVWVLA